jgi:glyoxylase-like metal-dependent hydrolase (beta-lactamase superfamily II)
VNEPTITPAELDSEIAAGRVPLVLDVRNRDEFAEGSIEGRRDVETRNVPVYDFLEDPAAYRDQVPEGTVIVCGHGNGSDMAVEELSVLGVRARSLEGGMEAWRNLLVPVPLPGLPEGTRGWQLQRPAKGCLSYVIGVPGGRGLVVDPARDVEPYLELAHEHDMTIVHVVDTHVHADHVSGGQALAASLGAAYSLPPEDSSGELPFPHHVLVDGETIDLGDEATVTAMTMHLPGHTPGTTALHVGRVLLVGDTVFVRGLGRPDLTGQAEDLARDLFRSVHERLEPLDPQSLIAPAHWSSREEFGEDGLVTATLAEVFESTLLNETAIEKFVEEIVATLPSAPDSYDTIRLVNAGLLAPSEDEIDVLDVGRNQCAASTSLGHA